MPVGVVASFEVVDIDHCDGIGRFEAKQGLVKSAARRERGEFVVIGQKVRGFDDGNCQNQRSGGEIGSRYSPEASKIESQKRSRQCPKQAALYRLAKEQKAN